MSCIFCHAPFVQDRGALPLATHAKAFYKHSLVHHWWAWLQALTTVDTWTKTNFSPYNVLEELSHGTTNWRVICRLGRVLKSKLVEKRSPSNNKRTKKWPWHFERLNEGSRHRQQAAQSLFSMLYVVWSEERLRWQCTSIRPQANKRESWKKVAAAA